MKEVIFRLNTKCQAAAHFPIAVVKLRYNIVFLSISFARKGTLDPEQF